MSEWLSYQIGQIARAVSETERKVDRLTEKVDSALTWAQRLALMVLALLGAIGVNIAPEKAGEALATFLKAIR